MAERTEGRTTYALEAEVNDQVEAPESTVGLEKNAILNFTNALRAIDPEAAERMDHHNPQREHLESDSRSWAEAFQTFSFQNDRERETCAQELAKDHLHFQKIVLDDQEYRSARADGTGFSVAQDINEAYFNRIEDKLINGYRTASYDPAQASRDLQSGMAAADQYLVQFRPTAQGSQGTISWDRQVLGWLHRQENPELEHILKGVAADSWQEALDAVRESEKNPERSSEARNMLYAMQLLTRYELERATEAGNPQDFHDHTEQAQGQAHRFAEDVSYDANFNLTKQGQIYRVDFRKNNEILAFIIQNNLENERIRLPENGFNRLEDLGAFQQSMDQRMDQRNKRMPNKEYQSDWMDSRPDAEELFKKEAAKAKELEQAGKSTDSSPELAATYRRAHLLAQAQDLMTRHPEPTWLQYDQSGATLPEISENQLKEQLLEKTHDAIQGESTNVAQTTYEVYVDTQREMIHEYHFNSNPELGQVIHSVKSADREMAQILERMNGDELDLNGEKWANQSYGGPEQVERLDADLAKIEATLSQGNPQDTLARVALNAARQAREHLANGDSGAAHSYATVVMALDAQLGETGIARAPDRELDEQVARLQRQIAENRALNPNNA